MFQIEDLRLLVDNVFGSLQSTDTYQKNKQSPSKIHLLISLGREDQRSDCINLSIDQTGELKQNILESLSERLNLAGKANNKTRIIKLEVVSSIEVVRWHELRKLIAKTKRNYFSYGISLDESMRYLIPNGDIIGSCLLYSSNNQVCEPRQDCLEKYSLNRFGKKLKWPDDDDKIVAFFKTVGSILIDKQVYSLESNGSFEGYRTLPDWPEPKIIKDIINKASSYLANEINESGKYTYGRWPCFDKEIRTYNTLRHFSSTYSLFEGYQITQKNSLIQKANRCLEYGLKTFGREHLIRKDNSSKEIAMTIEEINGEHKLGAVAHAILALCKSYECNLGFKSQENLLKLTKGLLIFQDKAKQGFVHVIDKNRDIMHEFRTIYYDGEALFALTEAYKKLGYDWILERAILVAEYFIEQERWKAHDHWQAYAFCSLYEITSNKSYLIYALINTKGYLDFIKQRITTYPTLLELCMATHRAINLAYKNRHADVVSSNIDLKKFYNALHFRARYLINGFFWPEVSMHFKNPKTITNSFFIRHHGFRTRIDDNEHYISGLTAYYNSVKSSEFEVIEKKIKNTEEKNCKLFELPNDCNSCESLLQQKDNLELVVNNSTVHIAFGGDVNCGRRQHYVSSEGREGFKAALSGINILHEVDLNVVNLECVIASVGDYKIDKSEQAPYYFRGRPETVNILKSANVGLVSLANNHSFDYGDKAFQQQSKILSDVNIEYVGAGENKIAAFSSKVFHIKDIKISFFAFDTTMKSFSAKEDKAGTAHVELGNVNKLIEEFACKIKDSKKTSDFVIFLCHWEWPPTITPSIAKVNMGHALIDMGADAVIGSSGHKLHGTEIYKGCPIVYDAGNLLFDAVQKGYTNTAIFDLILDKSGIIQILFHPVGSYFGYSKSLSQEEALLVSKEYSNKCSMLNTKLKILSNGESIINIRKNNYYYLRREKKENNYMEYRKTEWSDDLESNNCTMVVPSSHQVTPICFNPLQLLGFHCETGLTVNCRQTIWFKTYWRCQSIINQDYRIMIHLINEATGAVLWGLSSDHDPCDWQIPTSRWNTHNIYIDRCGLRPLPSRQLSDCILKPVIYLIYKGNIIHKADINLSIVFENKAVNSFKPLFDFNFAKFKSFQESPTKASIPQDIQMYFMVHRITKERSGLENSVLKRLQMFKRNKMLSAKILINQYNPTFYKDLAFIKSTFPSIEASDFLNIFDHYQECKDYTRKPIDHIDLPKKWALRHVEETSDLRAYDEKNQFRMYIKRDTSNLSIEYINHFHEGCKIRRDTYDSRGFLSRIQHLDKESRPSSEIYFRPDATIALTNHISYESKSPNYVFYIYDKNGVCIEILDGFNQLVFAWLQSIYYKANTNLRHFFVCDRSESYLNATLSIKKVLPNVFVIPFFHSTITYNGQEPLQSPIKSYVKNVVSNSFNVDCVIVATESQRNDLCTRFKDLNVVNIGHPICLSKKPERQIKSVNNKNVVYISRYDLDKNHLDAIDVFSKVLEKVPDARMSFYGSGEKYKRVLIDKINQQNLNDNVFINGFDENVNKIYQDSDISISTSIREGFSLAILESLSNGCPVIAYDVKYGPSEMIKNNINGYLVPFGDKSLMTEKIVELLTNNQKRLNMSDNSLLDTSFSEEKIFYKWISLISTLLACNSKDK